MSEPTPDEGTNALAQARDELATALKGAGINALPAEPERVTPPVALVSPATPYVSGTGNGYGRFELRERVRLVAERAEADVATDALDALICQAVPAIESFERPGPDGWAVLEVSQPYLLAVHGANLPAVDLTCKTTVKI